MDEHDTIFVDVKSAHSYLSLYELINEAYDQEQISIFQYQIGSHIPAWRKAKVGDEVIYAIDDVGVCGGEITFLRTRAYRPIWYPDHDPIYKTHISFTQEMCCDVFDDEWVKCMINQHIDAIERKRWLF